MPERTSTFSPVCARAMIARKTRPKMIRGIQSLFIIALFRGADERPNEPIWISHEGFRAPIVFPRLLDNFVSGIARALDRCRDIDNGEVWIHPPARPRVRGPFLIPIPMPR